MKFAEYRQQDALGLAHLVRTGQVHPKELLQLAIERADQTDPQITAMMRRLDDMARDRCEQPFDPANPFMGVPFVIKDLFQDIKGVPSTGGSRALRHMPVTDTSDVVRRWQDAGLVIFGKSKTPEFGARNVTEPTAFGPARNPWDTTRTPGGSSGGSAALVAAGVVPVAGANDGGGSIRIPAAACGLLGLKAGRGRIPIGPMMAEGMFGAAVQGVVSRSVRDTAAMMDIMQGPEPHAPYWMPAPESSYLEAIQRPPRKLRIGFTTDSPLGLPVDPQAIAAVEDAVALLTSLGHEVEPSEQPMDGQTLSSDFLMTWFCMMAGIVTELQARYGATPADFEPDTRAMAAVGRSVSAMELLNCLDRWNSHNRTLSAYHQRYDLWLSPTLSAPPPAIGAMDTPKFLHLVGDVVARLGLSGLLRKTPQFQSSVLKNLAWTPYTQLANLTGRPAMSVPLYWTPQGLPLGVQFVAPLNGEALLLQLAAQLEQARPWAQRHAPL